MDLSFTSQVDFIAQYFFSGSTTLAGLAMLLGLWIVTVVVLINLKASPAYSVVPMIPGCIFFSAYGILNESIALLIMIVSAVIIAAEFKRVAD